MTRRSELPEHDRRAPLVDDAEARERSRRHRHPWGSAMNVTHQARLALGKLAVIPLHERDERIIEAERHLRLAHQAGTHAQDLLSQYYEVGR